MSPTGPHSPDKEETSEPQIPQYKILTIDMSVLAVSLFQQAKLTIDVVFIPLLRGKFLERHVTVAGLLVQTSPTFEFIVGDHCDYCKIQL